MKRNRRATPASVGYAVLVEISLALEKSKPEVLSNEPLAPTCGIGIKRQTREISSCIIAPIDYCSPLPILISQNQCKHKPHCNKSTPKSDIPNNMDNRWPLKANIIHASSLTSRSLGSPTTTKGELISFRRPSSKATPRSRTGKP